MRPTSHNSGTIRNNQEQQAPNIPPKVCLHDYIIIY